MKTLLMTRHDPDGSEKVYRFSAEEGQFIIGSSRKAHLRLPKDESEVIEAIIERDAKGWTYHSFRIVDDQTPIIYDLRKSPEIKVGNIILKAKVLPDVSFFSIPEKIQPLPPEKLVSTGTSLGSDHVQIILVYFQGELLTSNSCEVGAECELAVHAGNIKVKAIPTLEWVSSREGDYEIRQKSVLRSDIGLFKVPLKDYIPREKHDRATIGVLFTTFIIGLVSSFFTPNPTVQRPDTEPPKSSPVVIKLSPTQQKPKKEEVVAQNKEAAPANRMDKLRNLASVGKAGLFKHKAIKIPTAIGNNGKLKLAAVGVGRLDGPTTDWNAMAGSKVSGKVGGGKLTGGTGSSTSLSAGATGQSGLSLLDNESEVSGGLDKEIIAAFIRENIGHILYCYERSLSANPNLFGKVSVKFTIAGTGKVETQAIGESTLRNKQVESCILDKISRWKFPEPKGGVKVVVTYPFLFKTTN